MIPTSIAKALLSEDHVYEWYGDRVRFFIGNLARWDEREGGGRVGYQFNVDVGIANHVGEFDVEDHGPWNRELKRWESYEKHEFLSHSFSLMLGRYGILFSWRGREITGTDWDVPRWQLNDPEYQ